MSRAHRSIAVLFVWLASVGSGCTVRFSQHLVGEIESRGPTRTLQTSGSGAEFGVVGPRAVWVLDEPRSAYEITTPVCEVAFAQVDYRKRWFGIPVFYVYPAASFPETRVTSYCIVTP